MGQGTRGSRGSKGLDPSLGAQHCTATQESEVWPLVIGSAGGQKPLLQVNQHDLAPPSRQGLQQTPRKKTLALGVEDELGSDRCPWLSPNLTLQGCMEGKGVLEPLREPQIQGLEQDLEGEGVGEDNVLSYQRVRHAAGTQCWQKECKAAGAVIPHLSPHPCPNSLLLACEAQEAPASDPAPAAGEDPPHSPDLNPTLPRSTPPLQTVLICPWMVLGSSSRPHSPILPCTPISKIKANPPTDQA